MATQTPNRNYEKPTPGADDDIWGGLTNQNWDTLDDEVQTLFDAAIPIGVIMAWFDTAVSIPAGWGRCDGTVYTRTDGAGSITSPDLQARFIIGATGDGTGTHPFPGADAYDGSGNGADYTNLHYIMKI